MESLLQCQHVSLQLCCVLWLGKTFFAAVALAAGAATLQVFMLVKQRSRFLKACFSAWTSADSIASATRAGVAKETLAAHLNQLYCCNHWSNASMSCCNCAVSYSLKGVSPFSSGPCARARARIPAQLCAGKQLKSKHVCLQLCCDLWLERHTLQLQSCSRGCSSAGLHAGSYSTEASSEPVGLRWTPAENVAPAVKAVVLKETLPLYLDQPYYCNHWSSASMFGCKSAVSCGLKSMP